MREGKAPLWKAAKALLPRVERAAAKLGALASVNRTVHLPTYNRVIADEARALKRARTA